MKPALSAIALAFGASVASAAPQLVTNPQMCGLSAIDGQELGMTLTASEMFEIEYYCAFEPPVEFRWDGDVTTTRLGYCSEPGLIEPILVTFQFGSYEPGVVNLWWQGGDAPTRFLACE
ncbi:hypothetical protein AIOL_003015 [Candidatus Rhodobacter oscarellae]|uniref:Uncharacterized protein n=1 Tax=Candidatus Rhodobacter oscarellae TaxID=1675527 RepID=A0A0J9E5K7_9RHOB|nr:hypothetical protein [Candidatus Rhodobacter lobularis]KMW58045.1 hypothetical protein AIOL_003015 [Candidatus Rhodobacter lobularis]